MTDDRAVTEVLGYILVIALVTATIAVVLTTGISGLHGSQEAEQVNNMERAFDVLAHNVEELVHRGAPTRATELRLVSGSITYAEPVEITVTQDNAPIENVTIVSEPIRFSDGGDREIVYEAGAVFRTDGTNSVMLREPVFLLSPDRVLVSGIRTRPLSGSPDEVRRDGTVLIRKEHLGVVVGTGDVANGPVNITVSSPRADAWARYLDEQTIGELVVEDDDYVVYRLDEDDLAEVESIHIVRQRIRTTLVE